MALNSPGKYVTFVTAQLYFHEATDSAEAFLHFPVNHLMGPAFQVHVSQTPYPIQL